MSEAPTSAPTIETSSHSVENTNSIDTTPNIESGEVVANAEGRIGNVLGKMVIETPGFTEPSPGQFGNAGDPETPVQTGGRRRAGKEGGVSVADLKARESELASQQTASPEANISTLTTQETDVDALGASIADQLNAFKQTTEEFGRENNITPITPEAPADPDILGENIKEQLEGFKESNEQFGRENNVSPEVEQAKAPQEAQAETATTTEGKVEDAILDRPLSVAEIAQRLEVEDGNELAGEIITRLGHNTLRAVSKENLKNTPTVEAIDDITQHNQSGNNPIGLRAFVKNAAKAAYARFMQRASEFTGVIPAQTTETSTSQSERPTPPPQEVHTRTQQEKDNEELNDLKREFYANKIEASLDEAYRMNERFDENLKKREKKEKSKASFEADETLTPYEQYIQARRYEAMLKARAKNIARIRRQEAFQAKKEQWSDAAREKWDNAKNQISTSRIGRIGKGIARAARFTASVGRGMFRGAKAGARAHRIAQSKR